MATTLRITIISRNTLKTNRAISVDTVIQGRSVSYTTACISIEIFVYIEAYWKKSINQTTKKISWRNNLIIKICSDSTLARASIQEIPLLALQATRHLINQTSRNQIITKYAWRMQVWTVGASLTLPDLIVEIFTIGSWHLTTSFDKNVFVRTL